MPPIRKPRRSKGKDHYEAYLAALRARSCMPGLTRPPQTAYVVVATCSGCARLSETAGHRIALIFVATDPAAELARLRRRAHGGWLLQDSIDAPFLLEPGWHDWTAVDLDIAMTRGAILPEGPCIKAGRNVSTIMRHRV